MSFSSMPVGERMMLEMAVEVFRGEALDWHYLSNAGFIIQKGQIMQQLQLAVLEKYCRRKQARPH